MGAKILDCRYSDPAMVEDAAKQLKVTDVVLAVIVREGRVLIARRREQDAFGGYWELPGGKRNPGESVADCLAREIREELGIEVRPGYEFIPVVYAYPDKTVRLLAISCQISAAADPRPLAADCLAWATASELPTYRFPAANGPLIERIVAWLSRHG
jgi:mutator protein MutT